MGPLVFSGLINHQESVMVLYHHPLRWPPLSDISSPSPHNFACTFVHMEKSVTQTVPSKAVEWLFFCPAAIRWTRSSKENVRRLDCNAIFMLLMLQLADGLLPTSLCAGPPAAPLPAHVSRSTGLYHPALQDTSITFKMLEAFKERNDCCLFYFLQQTGWNCLVIVKIGRGFLGCFFFFFLNHCVGRNGHLVFQPKAKQHFRGFTS